MYTVIRIILFTKYRSSIAISMKNIISKMKNCAMIIEKLSAKIMCDDSHKHNINSIEKLSNNKNAPLIFWYVYSDTDIPRI